MKKNNYYYDVGNDINRYPEAVFHFIVGGRNTGKTYSMLKYCYIDNKITFGFIKRTNDDIKFLTQGGTVKNKGSDISVDTSPFKPINRDYGTNIKAISLDKGFGGFFETGDDGEPIGQPVGYLLSLNSVVNFKGFDLSDIDILIFDEYIPNIYERVNHNEGEQVLDLIKTITRDREHRGRKPLKCFFLANATRIACPIHEQFELVDMFAEMQAINREYFYNKDRQILIHMINTAVAFMNLEEQTALYKCMSNTAWGQMAYSNNFGYDDFSDIEKKSLKGFRPLIEITYKQQTFYIYIKDVFLYATDSKAKKIPYKYNFNREADRRRYFMNHYSYCRIKNSENNMSFKKYSYYNIIINFKKLFKL